MKPFAQIALNMLVTLAAVIAFNLIIGVFGMNASILSLVVFVCVVVLVARRNQPEEK